MVSTTVETGGRRRKPLYQDMSIQVLAGMALGALIGWAWPDTAEAMGALGSLFIRLIAMFVGLIIFCSLVHGIATMREVRRVGRVAVKAIFYFEAVTTGALVIGLATINILGPGRGMHVTLPAAPGAAINGYLNTAHKLNEHGFLLQVLPKTALSAFTDGNVLQVVFLSVLFAFGLLATGDRGKPMVDMIDVAAQAIYKVIGFIMWLAPLGAMGAIGFTVARFGLGSLVSLGKLVGEFYLTCALFILLILWPIARWNGLSLWRLARYIGTELLLVAGTNSSESVFPQLVSKLRRLGCEESIVGLVLPTGYAFNHDGTCLYFAAASVFLAQATGIEMTLAQQLGLLGILLLTSKGGANVAGSAIVVLVSTLAATGIIPVAAVALILGIHRLLASAFVAVNILGNALATIVIARSEGVVDLAALANGLRQGPD
ncbi:MAG TPA: cation:dicarboxylase symporter family transporter [Stellaceae bacterium]|nr:cation:dicarboxylase symporter family transporter [Stellaceae bacterium]